MCAVKAENIIHGISLKVHIMLSPVTAKCSAAAFTGIPRLLL
jgi:hypothetical protein